MTTADLPILRSLLERVRAAEGPSKAIDEAVAETFGWTATYLSGGKTAWYPPIGGPYLEDFPPAFTTSIDAAVGLVERVLPCFWWDIARGERVVALGVRPETRGRTEGPYWGYVYDEAMLRASFDGEPDPCPGASPAIALLGAFLGALVVRAEAEHKEPPDDR
jgi:hypothetical protein